MSTLKVNGKNYVLPELDTEMPLLWALRDHLGFVGTRFGCGVGQCGACSVLVNGVVARACQFTVAMAEGAAITTVEGLAADDGELHPLQQAWIDHDVAQCGYCQSGQLISAFALLERNTHPSEADIDNAMAGNLCRCGTYTRIRAAIKTAASDIRKNAGVQTWTPAQQREILA